MAYEPKFTATDDGDWIEVVELFDNETGDPLAEATGAAFEMEVSDGDHALLSASTAAGTITHPEDHILTWRFRLAELARLCVGHTYLIGFRMIVDGDVVIPLFVGTLTFKRGGFV